MRDGTDASGCDFVGPRAETAVEEARCEARREHDIRVAVAPPLPGQRGQDPHPCLYSPSYSPDLLVREAPRVQVALTSLARDLVVLGIEEGLQQMGPRIRARLDRDAGIGDGGRQLCMVFAGDEDGASVGEPQLGRVCVRVRVAYHPPGNEPARVAGFGRAATPHQVHPVGADVDGIREGPSSHSASVARRAPAGREFSTYRPYTASPEAMEILSMSRTVIYEQIRAGRLRAARQGRARLISASAFTDYVALIEREAMQEAA